MLGGYWMIQVKSKEEAVEWAKRCPARPNEMIEIRQVQEMSDFPADVQKAAADLPKCRRRQKAASPSKDTFKKLPFHELQVRGFSSDDLPVGFRCGFDSDFDQACEAVAD